MKESNKHDLYGIQILRGLAACMVILVHATISVKNYYGEPSPWFKQLAESSAFGVDLFFTISGFIMIYAHRAGERGAGSAHSFLLKRAKRIYPLYWFWTTVWLVLWLSGSFSSVHFDTAFIIKSYLLYPSSDGLGHFSPILYQGWTLTFEVFFYIVFAVSIWIGARRVLVPLLFLFFLALQLFSRLDGLPPSLAYLIGSPLLFEFLLGALAGEIFLLVNNLRNRGLTPVAGAVAALAMLLLFLVLRPLPGTHLSRAIWFGPIAFVVVLGVSLANIRWNMRWRIPIFLGNASYSIYLTAEFFDIGASRFLKTVKTLPLHPDVVACIVTAVIVVLSSQTWKYIELPISRFVNRKPTQRLGRSASDSR